MIFEALNDAEKRGELILVDGGMCHFHRRRDGVVTVREVIVLKHRRRWGIGRHLVARAGAGAKAVVARCPADLPANRFWAALGFVLTAVTKTKTGREVNTWRLDKP